MRINKIILYDEPTVPEIKLKNQKDFLNKIFHVEIETRKSFFEETNTDILERIEEARVFNLKQPFEKQTDVKNSTVSSEYRKESSLNEEMIFYDGFEIQRLIAESVPDIENNTNTLYIIFTNKLTCTFDKDDFRYHVRALIGSNPTIISTSGMIEGPAKPKEYYLDVMTSFSHEDIESINEKYKDRFLGYNDPRISDISEGYLLQSILYVQTGDAFCNDKNCRLFNAHWQEELLSTQVKNKKFCKRHFKILEELIDQSNVTKIE